MGTSDVGITPQMPSAPVLPSQLLGLPSVGKLVDHVIEALPRMANYRLQLERMITLALLYTGKVLGAEFQVIKVTREMALRQLSLRRPPWTIGEIETSMNELAEGIGSTLQEIRDQFEIEAGTRIELPTLPAKLTDAPFTDRLKQELAEQQQYVDWARKLLSEVEQVRAALVMPDAAQSLLPGEVRVAKPPSVEKPAKRGWFTSIGEAAKRSGLGGVLAEYTVWAGGQQLPTEVSVLEEFDEEPGWLTKPVLQEDDLDIQTLETIVIPYLPFVSTYGREAVWTYLTLQGLDKESLLGLQAKVAQKAQHQLARSEKIIQATTADKEQHSRQILALGDVETTLRSVADFFLPPGEVRAQG